MDQPWLEWFINFNTTKHNVLHWMSLKRLTTCTGLHIKFRMLELKIKFNCKSKVPNSCSDCAKNLYTNLRRRWAGRRRGALVGQAVLIHDPVRLRPARGPPLVVHQRLLQPNQPFRVGCAPDGPVGPGRLPEPPLGRPVGPPTVGLLPVPRHEKVPLPLANLC